jgi:uncharacterized protein involved in outer membrane biogenesis
MSTSLKRTFVAAGALLGLLVLGALATLLVLRVNTKPRLEALASEALGMQVEVGGRARVRLFPSLGVTLEDVRIRNHGLDIAAVKEATLAFELVSLLRRQMRISHVALQHITVSVEQGHDGKYNFEHEATAHEAREAVDLANVSVSDATLLYKDQQTGNELQAGPCSVDIDRLQISARTGPGLLKYLSANAVVACGSIRTKDLGVPDVKFSLAGTNGVFDLKPVTLRMFGGHGSGEVRADYSGLVPAYRIHYMLAKFRIEEFFKSFSQKKLGEGSMDFSTNLTMQGHNTAEMKRTMKGEASLHGNDLILETGDLDRDFAHYESTQSFNLIDVGAFFFAGPVGLAVTKGYDYATIFRGSGGNSTIRSLISEWKIDHGVAQAQDVAMATKENRVALKGGLNFVDGRFDDVSVALVDAKGCPRVIQAIRGPFGKPEVEKPHVLSVLAGPTLQVLKKIKSLLGGKCEVFYAGSLAPPK